MGDVGDAVPGTMSASRHVLLGAALLSMSVSGPLIRFAAAPALAIVVWRVALAWPVLAGTSLVRGGPWPLRQGAAAGVFLAVHWIAWVLAVQRTSIASASLLICTGALWSALLSRPLLREAISRRQWIGLALGTAGVGLVVSAKNSGAQSMSGDLLALVGAMAWVAYTFIGRRARQQGSFWSYASTVYLVAGLASLSTASAIGAQLLPLDRDTWLALAAMALFPTLIGHGGMNYLLRYMGPARLGLWTLSEPVLATGLAWPLFGEIPTARVIAGGLLTLAGIGLGVSG